MRRACLLTGHESSLEPITACMSKNAPYCTGVVSVCVRWCRAGSCSLIWGWVVLGWNMDKPNERLLGGGPGFGVEVQVRRLSFIVVGKAIEEGGREGGREGRWGRT